MVGWRQNIGSRPRVNFAPGSTSPLYISVVSLKKRSKINCIVIKIYRIGTCGSIESKKNSKIRQKNWGGDWRDIVSLLNFALGSVNLQWKPQYTEMSCTGRRDGSGAHMGEVEVRILIKGKKEMWHTKERRRSTSTYKEGGGGTHRGKKGDMYCIRVEAHETYGEEEEEGKHGGEKKKLKFKLI